MISYFKANIKQALKRSPIAYKLAMALWQASWQVYKKVNRKLVIAIILYAPSIANIVARLLSSKYRNAADAVDSGLKDQLSKTVLFVLPQPHSREPRIAAAARFAGWEPLLIYIGKPKYNPSDYFKVHACVGSLFQLALVCRMFKGPIIHLFVSFGDAAYLICATKNCPIVLDIYDTLSGITWATIDQKRDEKEAIRLADGMTHRDLRVKYLKKLYNYSIPKKNIFIHDPLMSNNGIPGKYKCNDEIHVISVGAISGTGNRDNCIIRTVTALANASIHVHVFHERPQSVNLAGMECYNTLQEESPYFHIEKPIHGKDYWEFLSRCDFGLSVFEPDIFNELPEDYTPDYLYGCGSSRLMDYVQMNLGVIVSPGVKFIYFLAKRYAPVVVPATRDFIQNPRPFLEAALNERKKVTRKNLSGITVEGVAPRLKKFYDQVAFSKGKTA